MSAAGAGSGWQRSRPVWSASTSSAERSEKRGFVFSPYEEEMDEFESAFEFEETPDQLSSVAEIKEDMCSSKVMDRLLCGDVGYGKTEVAFRAAYLCILNGKQAALMCPNTILCQQHYESARKRFSEFGVQIDVLRTDTGVVRFRRGRLPL